MTTVRLGFFKSFKGADTLLVEADSAGFDALVRSLTQLSDGSAASLDLDAQPWMEVHHGVQLSARCGPRDLGVFQEAATRFIWILSADGWDEIVGLLEPLVQHDHGHQYLDERADVTVMASRDEYGDVWWAEHG